MFWCKRPLLVLFIFTVTSICKPPFSKGARPRKGIQKRGLEAREKTPSSLPSFTQKLQQVAQSISRNPFKVWFFKDRFKSGKDLLLTPQLYSSEIIQRNSTTTRLKEAIKRSLRGENLTIVVMGGSISAGAGLALNNESLQGVYHRVFVDWWQKAVEPFTGSTTKLRNLSIGGTGSNFFAYCYNTLLNPSHTFDVAFLDFTVNDYLLFKTSIFPLTRSLEQLTRELLSEKNSPAVIFVNFVQGLFSRPVCRNLEDHGQTRLAQNYKITSFSLRNLYCSNFSTEEAFGRMFAADGNHVSILAHAQMAIMIINYVRETMLQVIFSLLNETAPLGYKLSLNGHMLMDCPLDVRALPKPVFEKQISDFIERPLCFTLLRPSGRKKSSVNQSLTVQEIGNIGFEEVSFLPVAIQERLEIGPATRQFRLRTDVYGGWEAETANSLLQLQLFVPMLTLSHHCLLRSETPARNVVVAVRTHGNGGKATVWLDEYEEKGIAIDTFSPFGQTKLHVVARHVIPGRHVLNLRTSRNGTFTLCAVMLGPVNR